MFGPLTKNLIDMDMVLIDINEAINSGYILNQYEAIKTRKSAVKLTLIW